SHHAFRRDLAQLAAALEPFDAKRAGALREAWMKFDGNLHGHHEKEDTGIFPMMLGSHPELASAIAELEAQHNKTDPALDRGRTAFASLPGAAGDAVRVVRELTALLDAHLDFEEATIIPLLRTAKEFPAAHVAEPELDLFASGFAWSLEGIAPEIVA